MRARRGARAAALAGAAVALLGAAPTGTLDVRLDAVRSTRGTLRICLTAAPANFPGCLDDRAAVFRNVPASQRAVRIDGLGPGGYAISVIHDENDNTRLDTFAGIPREGFGFSRNPAIGFGPPRFSAARFTLDGDAGVQHIRIRYLL